MAITATHKETTGDVTNTDTYITGSLTSTNGGLLICFLNGGVSGAPTSLTSTHGTWTLRSSQNNLLLMYSCPANGNTGTISINWSSPRFCCSWSVAEYNGHNADDPFVQIVKGGISSPQPYILTLGSFENALNATFSGILFNSLHGVTPGSGFTELGEIQLDDATVDMTLQQQWRNDNDTTVDITVADSYTDSVWMIGVELREATVIPASGFFAFI